MLGESLDGDAALPCERDDVGLAGATGGKLDERMQPGGDAADSDGGRVPGEHGGQSVAPGPVADPALADVPVVGTAVDHVGEHELVNDARVPVHVLAQVCYRLDQVRRQGKPGQPQARGQGLAGGAGVDDMAGGQSLHRADRLPVVAELPS